jgi:alanyl-tRNA synthetase
VRNEETLPLDARHAFVDTFADAGFRRSEPLALLQPGIATSFLFSVGFVDVLAAVAGDAAELDGAVTLQRCFRHFDVERTADDRHLSLFEMAGALRCSGWNMAAMVQPLARFLAHRCGLPYQRLHVTYFGGGKVAGQALARDAAARDAYLAAGFSAQRIWPGGPDTNVWHEGANSGTPRSGICGPHSEVFYDLDPARAHSPDASPLTRPARFLELSNIVTITHRSRGGARGLDALPQPLIELAVGMERIDTVLAGERDVYASPKLAALRAAVRAHSAARDGGALRVAADHLRALTHLLADGGVPGPKGRGHVLRRLFRRLIDAADVLQLDLRAAYPALAATVCDVDAALNPALALRRGAVVAAMDAELARMLARRRRAGT